MRIATWNINSVRLRLDLVLRLAAEQGPDVLCLQEIKCLDDVFPKQALANAGYQHQHIHGMKSYNGVAILSRLPFAETSIQHWCGKEDRRHIAVRLQNGIEVHNYYVPAGGDLPDPVANDKFAHKLKFMDEAAIWWKTQSKNQHPKILVGDLNVAPMEHDVWSHKQMLDVVSHTPIEVEKLTAWQQAHAWHDAVRHFVPATQKLYSWWSYRAADWALSNRGRRLDHVWVTPNLVSGLKQTVIVRDARGWEPKPSDHVPVVVDIAV